MSRHEDISKRAREIWEREGRPEGRDKEHWLQAEAELQQELGRNSEAMGNGNGITASVGETGAAFKEDNGRKRTARRGK
jgi:hypothetical protein